MGGQRKQLRVAAGFQRVIEMLTVPFSFEKEDAELSLGLVGWRSQQASRWQAGMQSGARSGLSRSRLRGGGGGGTRWSWGVLLIGEKAREHLPLLLPGPCRGTSMSETRPCT